MTEYKRFGENGSGYEMVLYTAGNNEKVLLHKSRNTEFETHIYRKSFMLGIICPQQMDVEEFVTSLKKAVTLTAADEEDIRQTRGYSIEIASNKTGAKKIDSDIFETLNNAGIPISEPIETQIKEIVGSIPLDVDTPLRGREWNAESQKRAFTSQRDKQCAIPG